MFVWKSALTIFNILMVNCVRNPNEIVYIEKGTLTPSLEELKSGNESLTQIRRAKEIQHFFLFSSRKCFERKFRLCNSGSCR